MWSSQELVEDLGLNKRLVVKSSRHLSHGNLKSQVRLFILVKKLLRLVTQDMK